MGLHGGIVGIRQAGYTWRFRVCVCPFGVNGLHRGSCLNDYRALDCVDYLRCMDCAWRDAGWLGWPFAAAVLDCVDSVAVDSDACDRRRRFRVA